MSGEKRDKNDPIRSQDYENLECNRIVSRGNNHCVIYMLNRLKCKNAQDSINFSIRSNLCIR